MYNPAQVGTRFGSLVIIEDLGVQSLNKTRAHAVGVQCDCGTVRIVRYRYLREGQMKTCGGRCKRRTHGLSKSPEYRCWQAMQQRCNNPKVAAYPDYGGRGIKVCERWRNSFEAFYQDAGPRPSPDHSIDRIDNDGDYEPGNVRWVDGPSQQRNRRANVSITFNGESLPLSAWAERYGLHRQTLWRRLKDGWPVEHALVADRHGRKLSSS